VSSLPSSSLCSNARTSRLLPPSLHLFTSSSILCQYRHSVSSGRLAIHLSRRSRPPLPSNTPFQSIALSLQPLHWRLGSVFIALLLYNNKFWVAQYPLAQKYLPESSTVPSITFGRTSPHSSGHATTLLAIISARTVAYGIFSITSSACPQQERHFRHSVNRCRARSSSTN